jgi:nitric oxide reductase NorE protein
MCVFALFFATFMYSRAKSHEAFAAAHRSLNVALGTTNTVLLLTSSLLVVIGVQRVLAGRSQQSTPLFAGALACGLGFIAVKAIEWTHLFSEGKSVGSGEYYSYYFMFTGIHALHVLIGLVLL